MTELDIDLQPDPERDARARREALALLAAARDDGDEAAEQEAAGRALQALLEVVVGPVEVRPESAPALSAMLSSVARQYSAFGAVAHVLAAEAFAAGQADPQAPGPDLDGLLAATGRVLDDLDSNNL